MTRLRFSRHQQRWAVRVVATASAVLSVVAGAPSPTGNALFDAALGAFASAGAPLAASRARRWTWVWASGLTAVAATSALAMALAIVALALSLGALARHVHSRVLGAVVGGLVIHALFRLGHTWRFGFTAMVGIAAGLPVVVSAFRVLPEVRRRRVMVAATAVGGLAATALLSLAWLGLGARADGERAMRHVQRAFDRMADADQEGAQEELRSAHDAFDAIERKADSWWALPTRVVPIAAQHRDAVAALAAAGADTTGDLAGLATLADVEAVQVRQGTVDLDALASLEQPARSAVDALKRASEDISSADSGWLVAPVDRRLQQLELEVSEGLRSARLAAEGARLGPSLLGADGRKSYIVLFGNPAESRELGGFVGGVGVLTADRGTLDFGGVEPVKTLARSLRDAELPPVDGIPTAMAAARPMVFPQNWTAAPDLPTVAKVVGAIWPRIRPESIDGVLYVDPFAASALLKLTGPVAVEGLNGSDGRVDATNVVDLVLRDQYVGLAAEEQGERKEALTEIGDAIFDKLTSGDLPGPRGLAKALGPAVGARHLLLWSAEEDADGFLTQLGLRGTLSAATPDLIHLTQSNTRANKLDAYIHRTVDYQVRVGDGGEIQATAEVVVRNEVDPLAHGSYVLGSQAKDGLPPGDHRIVLYLYTPWRMGGFTMGGQKGRSSSLPIGDLWQHSTVVTVPPGSSVTLSFDLYGSLDEGSAYGVTAIPFAGSTTDEMSIEVDRSGGSSDVAWSGELSETRQFGEPG